MANSSFLGLIKALPNFSTTSDRSLRRLMVARSAQTAFVLSTIIICFLIPLWNYLVLQKYFFKLGHHIRHHVLRRQTWIHRSRIYHNRAFKICTFWSIVATLCTMVGSQGDLVQITKRLGRIAVAFMPPLLFLTLRPTPLPHTLYLTLLPIHKWISRIVILQSLLHTFFYTWYFATTNKMFKILKPANMWGVLAMALFLLIAITSLPRVRRTHFRVFYYVHYIATWLTVILLHFHARPPMSWYTLMNVSILVFQIGYRLYHTKRTRVSIVKVSPSLALMEFPLADIPKTPTLPSAHLRINNYHSFSFLKRWFYQLVPFQHPFTIASLPSDETVKLIIRRGNFPLKRNTDYYVTGAFEPKIDFIKKDSVKRPRDSSTYTFQNNSPTLLTSPLSYHIDARRVLMVVGGSAISFGLPMLRILNFNGVNVRLIWVSRDYRDLRLLDHFKNNFHGMEIYITGMNDGEEQDLQIDYVDYEDDTMNDSEFEENSQSEESQVPTDSARLMARSTSGYGTIKTNNLYAVKTTQNLDNQGKINQDDEVDFTQLFSARSVKSKNNLVDKDYPSETVSSSPLSQKGIFRKPNIVVPPNDSSYKSDIESLGDDDGMKLKIPTGVKLFFTRPHLGSQDYQWCLQKECIGPSETNDCCQPNTNNTHVDDLSQVWVIAAGPPGLVGSTRRWATDGGLHFHAESFSV